MRSPGSPGCLRPKQRRTPADVGRLPAAGSAGVRVERAQASAQRVVDGIEVGVLDEPLGMMADPDELPFEVRALVREARDHDRRAVANRVEDPDQVGRRTSPARPARDGDDLGAAPRAIPGHARTSTPEVHDGAARWTMRERGNGPGHRTRAGRPLAGGGRVFLDGRVCGHGRARGRSETRRRGVG